MNEIEFGWCESNLVNKMINASKRRKKKNSKNRAKKKLFIIDHNFRRFCFILTNRDHSVHCTLNRLNFDGLRFANIHEIRTAITKKKHYKANGEIVVTFSSCLCLAHFFR